MIDHAAHLLPSQGPITVFVHHNTLHAFEDLPFEQALQKGLELYQCEPYLSEERYREEFHRGRIQPADISAALLDDLDDGADELIGFMGTRFHLRMAMLEHPLYIGRDEELRWLITETDALAHFREEAPAETRIQTIDQTRQWVLRVLENDGTNGDTREHQLVSHLLDQFPRGRIETWSNATWEAFTLRLLWRICHNGAHGVKRFPAPLPPVVRHRDLLKQATGRDSDSLIDEVLIRFSAAFLDQGFAHSTLPCRDEGFFASFRKLHERSRPQKSWLKELPEELRRIGELRSSPLESIDESLSMLGVPPAEQLAYLTHTLLALRGWAGMIWQMETNAEWTIHPAPSGTLNEFLAVRLILERLAIRHIYDGEFGKEARLDEMRADLQRRHSHVPRISIDQRAYLIFQLAQIRGWSPLDLQRQSKQEWTRLTQEIETFDTLQRRRIFHRAYERHYRNQILDAVIDHAGRTESGPAGAKSFQLVTCIDDREESFRRHLEEIDPRCETFGAPGFFAAPMYYRGASDAHFRPLCPVIIKPKHYVREDAAYSLRASSRQRAETRRMLGTASHRWHTGSRSLLGGVVTALLGSAASVPLVARILFPRLTAQLRRIFGNLIQPPAVTELRLYRTVEPPGSDDEHLGYTIDEMVNSVERVLRDVGLVRGFSRLVFLVGHGSGSLNNPHESAYNCGACSGGRGGPNARAFAQMANDPSVRGLLKSRGLEIPAVTHFVGAFHNTCDEDVTFFDLDSLPVSHRKLFEAARDVIDQARERNAHERCRRFESADLQLSFPEALEHVEARAEDLSQARPEYNHATNALCFVGRREWSRGLFLDRRVFLQSYDPAQDDAEHSILARILQPAVPVCAGISLEYYFSCVDVLGYGCGSKLPHNITSLLGVMEGAASDLRTGLSQQMIEIHEPMRILFLVESTPEAMLSIMDRNAEIGRLVRNGWIQLAAFDAKTNSIHVYSRGRFEPYEPTADNLPQAKSSIDWYRGWRDHLGCASIVRDPHADRRDTQITETVTANLMGSRGMPSTLRQGSTR